MANPSPNCGAWTTFKGVTDIGRAQLKETLEANLIEFFKWGLLGIGAFYNFTFPASGAYGGSFTDLRCSEDPNYTEGQVWEGPRQDWVWESGVQYGVQPIAISGVYVNGEFLPNGSGYTINYPLGRVIFETPLSPSGSTVECEYSARQWQVTSADLPWWREIQYNSLRVDDPEYLQYGSGVWSILSQNRVQLPHVLVEATSRQTYIPYGLGGGTRVNQEILFHILGEVPYDPKTMSDIICSQREKTINLFDKNHIADANAFPLDVNGNIAPGALSYPDLVAPVASGGYFWTQAAMLEMSSDTVTNAPPLYQSVVRATVQVDMGW